MAAAAAIILRKERDIVQMYRGAGATDATRARDPEELGLRQSGPFRLLVGHAVLREVGNGRYYLDEPSWEALRSLRHRVALIVLVVVSVLFLTSAFVLSKRV